MLPTERDVTFKSGDINPCRLADAPGRTRISPRDRIHPRVWRTGGAERLILAERVGPSGSSLLRQSPVRRES